MVDNLQSATNSHFKTLHWFNFREGVFAFIFAHFQPINSAATYSFSSDTLLLETGRSLTLHYGRLNTKNLIKLNIKEMGSQSQSVPKRKNFARFLEEKKSLQSQNFISGIKRHGSDWKINSKVKNKTTPDDQNQQRGVRCRSLRQRRPIRPWLDCLFFLKKFVFHFYFKVLQFLVLILIH